MSLVDCAGNSWPHPQIVFEDVREINRTLRESPVELQLPRLADGTFVTDFHAPQAQGWFLEWPGAPILVGAILLQTQIKQRELSPKAFASCWIGDSLDVLREAIWQAWLAYLPSTARERAKQIRQSLEAQRAMNADLLYQTIEILETEGQVIVTNEVGKLKERLQSLIARKTSGSMPDASGSPLDSTPTGN